MKNIFFVCLSRNVSKKLPGLQTNQRAELMAATAAIQQAIKHNAGTLTLYTDSKYVINCVTSWIANWKRNGWKNSKKEPVKNMEDIKLLDSLCSQHTVKWVCLSFFSLNFC